MGHAQSSPQLPLSLYAKAHLRMAAGAYHWDLVHRVKGKAAYFASRSSVPDDVPGLVALHPDLLADASLSRERFLGLMESLIQVAQYTRKAVSWPLVPCSHPWVLGDHSLQRPWPSNPDWIPHWAPHNQLMCLWKRQLSSSCLLEQQGVLPLELEHMKERYRLYRPMDPSPEKTLMARGRADPDFTKRLQWQPVEEVEFGGFAKQVTMNLIALPGSGVISPTTHFRMHAVYLGQAIRINYNDSTSRGPFNFPGDSHLYLPHLPDKPAPELQRLFSSFKEACLDPHPPAPAAAAPA